MSPFGTYYNTKTKNSGVGYFDKSARIEHNYSATKDVGPGSYEHYTEFGGKWYSCKIYISNNQKY